MADFPFLHIDPRVVTPTTERRRFRDELFPQGRTRPIAQNLDEAPMIPIDPIMRAVEQNDKNRLIQILKQRIGQPLPLLADSRKWTALHLAASRPECKECLELLLQYNGRSILACRDNQTDEGETALHIACEFGCDENVLVLLQNWCDSEKQTGKNYSALHIAASRGYMKIVQYLLHYLVNINVKGGKGRTPLHLSAKAGHVHVSGLLLTNGADIQSVDVKGNLPLHLACKCGTFETACLLLKQDSASINVKNSEGITPFMLAMKNFDAAGLQYLLENGAGIDICDNIGRTAVHFAASVNNMHIFSRLILSTSANYAEQWCLSNTVKRLYVRKYLSNSLDSYTCLAIKMGPDFLKVLMNSHLPRSVLQMPSFQSGMFNNRTTVLSPLAYLFFNIKSDKIREFDQCLDLLLKNKITMMDEFQRMFHENWPNSCEFVNPVLALVSNLWPNDNREHYFNLLIANNVTTDYCLQCYHNNYKPFATFNEYKVYYGPVIYALEKSNMEVVKLLLSNSVILEPDILCNYLIMAYTKRRYASSKDEEEARCLYAYLISLKPIYHKWDHHSNQFDLRECPFLPAAEMISNEALSQFCNTLYTPLFSNTHITDLDTMLHHLNPDANRFIQFPYVTAAEEFASVTLQQLCRTTIRQHLRETTLQDNLQNFRRKILELPLPKLLKEFLLFKN